MTNLPVPIPRTFGVTESETGAFLNSLRDALLFLLNPPVATVNQSLSQALTSGTPAPVAFDQTVLDSYGGHSNSTNNSRYTAQVAGDYLVAGSASFAGSGGGTNRKLQVYKNGSAVAYANAQAAPVSSGAIATAVALSPTTVFLNAGDYVEIWASCDTTGVSLTPNAANEAYMTVLWTHQ